MEIQIVFPARAIRTPSYWRRNIDFPTSFIRAFARPLCRDRKLRRRACAGSYRFVDHQRYLGLRTWFEAMALKKNVKFLVFTTLGIGASGSTGDSASSRAGRGRSSTWKGSSGRLSWDEWPEAPRAFFKAQRTPAGEDLILQKNIFIEYFSPP